METSSKIVFQKYVSPEHNMPCLWGLEEVKRTFLIPPWRLLENNLDYQWKSLTILSFKWWPILPEIRVSSPNFQGIFTLLQLLGNLLLIPLKDEFISYNIVLYLSCLKQKDQFQKRPPIIEHISAVNVLFGPTFWIRVVHLLLSCFKIPWWIESK